MKECLTHKKGRPGMTREQILEQASEADKSRLRYAWNVYDSIRANDLDHLGLPELRARTNLLHDAVTSFENLEDRGILGYDAARGPLRRLRERHEKTEAVFEVVGARVKESQRLWKQRGE